MPKEILNMIEKQNEQTQKALDQSRIYDQKTSVTILHDKNTTVQSSQIFNDSEESKNIVYTVDQLEEVPPSESPRNSIEEQPSYHSASKPIEVSAADDFINMSDELMQQEAFIAAEKIKNDIRRQIEESSHSIEEIENNLK